MELGNICQILHHTCSCHKDFDLIFLDSFVLETANIIFHAIRAPAFSFFHSTCIIVDTITIFLKFCVILCLHY